MDLGTIIGLVSGLGAIAYSIIAAAGMDGFASFIDIPSIVIVIGGTIAATLMSYPLNQFLSIFSIAKNAFVNANVSYDELINKFLDYGKIARTSGLLELENHLDSESDEFIKKSLQMAIDGTDIEIIRSTLTNEIDCLRLRHAQSQGIFETLAAQFPSWGMIGTLIGLVLLLQNLDDPSTIGPSMAVAILTTLYGSIFANFLCNPIAKKLEIKSAEEAIRRELILEGVICLAERKPSVMIEQKLISFLSNSQKKEIEHLEKS
ncbi:motility protein A [Clostridium perfringens]